MSVLLWGTLEGMGRSVPCELIAIRTALPGNSGEYQYSSCSVIKAPADLPDGDYQLRFAGHTTTVQRFNRSWLVGENPAAKVDREPTRAESLSA